jgi:hypothetical protein
MAHWPSSAGPAAHFALAVQRAMLSGSPLTQTLGHTKIHTRPPVATATTTLVEGLLARACNVPSKPHASFT